MIRLYLEGSFYVTFWYFDSQEHLYNSAVIFKYKNKKDVGMQEEWCESKQEM